MTLAEIGTLWRSRKAAMNIWQDRMFEMPTEALIAFVLQAIPTTEADRILDAIESERDRFLEEDKNGH